MLEHVGIIEFYKSYVGDNNIQHIHGTGKLFSFAANESGQLAVYALPIIGSRCIYNDAYVKCVDRTIIYDKEVLLSLAKDIETVYLRNGGVLENPTDWVNKFTTRNKDLCVSIIPSEEIYPADIPKQDLFQIGKYMIKGYDTLIMRGNAAA